MYSAGTALPLLLVLFVGCAFGQAPQPVIRYANTVGGSASNVPTAVAGGSDGSIYITGLTLSSDFPDATKLSTSHSSGNGDLFVVKIDPTGGKLIYSVIIGAAKPASIFVDASGTAYVAGTNAASDFPTTSGALSTIDNCFLLKLDPLGATLVYATRFACGTVTNIYPAGLTVDGSGNAYVTGYSQGYGVITTPGAYKTSGFGPFLTKVNAQGSALIYSTYLPSGDTYATAVPSAIALGPTGNAYITGAASARGFPTTVSSLPAEIPDSNGVSENDVFVAELSADGSQLVLATLFGGYGDDSGSAIVVDSAGDIYISGTSQSTTGQGAYTPFPTTAGALDTEADSSGFVSKLSPGADQFVFSTLVPDSTGASCMNVLDSGIDVIAVRNLPSLDLQVIGTVLVRISADGTSLVQSSLIAIDTGVCASGSGAFYLAENLSPGGIASPGLSPIGVVSSTPVWFSAIASDVPGSAVLDVNVGELNLTGWPASDGSFPAITQTFEATTGSQSVAIFASSLIALPADGGVTPSPAVTPAKLTLTVGQGQYTDRFYLFAPGVQNGLVVVPISVSSQFPGLTVSVPAATAPNSILRLYATNAESAPVTESILLSSVVNTGSEQPFLLVPVPYSAASENPWLTVTPSTGTTPAELVVSASPAGLAPGDYYGQIQFLDTTPVPRYGPFSYPNNITVVFQVGMSATPSHLVVGGPTSPTIRLSPESPSGSVTLPITSTGASLSFSVDPPVNGVSVSPSSGTTPATVTFSAAPVPLVNTTLGPMIQFRDKPGGTILASVSLSIYEAAAGYAAQLVPNGAAPGSFFGIILDNTLPEPLTLVPVNPGALPQSLGGYSFTLNGLPVPLLSYSNRTFLAQAPTELTPGTFPLLAFDGAGTQVASAQETIVAVEPVYFNGSYDNPSASKLDGSVIGFGNPVAAGDELVVSLTGQGAVTPPIASGLAAPVGTPSTPLALITATIGGKSATVTSASMSNFEAGILDVTIQVPDLIDGSYKVVVNVGEYPTGAIPVEVLSGQATPYIGEGGLVNGASFTPGIAPGSLFSIFGTRLASSVQSATTSPLPTALGGATVTLGGEPAYLLYASPGQINAQAPYDLPAGQPALAVVTVNGSSSSPQPMFIVRDAPGLFTFGQNRAVVQNQDYSINNTGNGATAGSYIIVYMTGSGPLDNTPAAGAPASTQPLSRVLDPVMATINGVGADVVFAGLAPGFVGLTQVNVQVPQIAPGEYLLTVSVNGEVSNSAMVTVK